MCNHGRVMLAISMVSIFICSLGLGSQAYGQDVQSSQYSSSTIKGITSSYGMAAGFKPEYYEESGQYLSQSLSLGLDLIKNVKFTISSGVTSLKDPESETQLHDTSLSLVHNSIYSSQILKVSGQVTHNLPTSEQSKVNGLQSTDAMRLSITTGNLPVVIGHTLSAKKYWFQETLDTSGQSNRDYDLATGISLSLAINRFTTRLSGAVIQRYFYNGTSDGLYEVSLGTSYSALDNLTVSTGIVTSEAQIVDQKRQQAKIYAKDLTAAYIGMSYQFLSGRG